MTKQELIEMVGGEEQADFALEIVLKNLKKDFVRQCIAAEVKQIEDKIGGYEAEGVIYRANGAKHVDWGRDEQSKCYDASSVLYKRNRTMSLLAVR